jgi:acyl dehydratase
MTAVLGSTWQVGDVLGPLVVDRVTRTTLALFAGGSGDHNEIHLDVDVARAAGMDDVFAQGMLGMAHLGRLLTDAFGPHSVRSFTTRFSAITPVNAEPRCTGTVVSVDNDLLTLDLSVVLRDGTATLAGTATVSLGAAL